MEYGTRNTSLRKPESTDPVLLLDLNTNTDTIDAAIAKCNWSAVVDPTANDDSADGYAPGSMWVNTTGHTIHLCESNSIGAALWRKVFPLGSTGADIDFGPWEVRAKTFESDETTGTAPFTIASTTVVPNLNVDMVDGLHSTDLCKTSGLTADWAAGAYKITAAQLAANIAIGTAPLLITSTTKVDNLNVDAVDGIHIPAIAAKGDILTGSAAGTLIKTTVGTDGKALVADSTADGGVSWAAGGMTFWNSFPGSPVHVDDNTFTVTDASNSNLYDVRFPPGTLVKWEKSGGGFQCAKIVASTYSANHVAYDLIGNTLSSGFTSMKYCIHPLKEDVFIVPGTLPGNTAMTDIAKTLYWDQARYVFSAQVIYKTACTTTNGVWDINDDGTSIFTSKPTATATQTVGTEVGSDSVTSTNLTAVARKSIITLDYDSGHATTPGADAYIYLWSMPVSWRYEE